MIYDITELIAVYRSEHFIATEEASFVLSLIFFVFLVKKKRKKEKKEMTKAWNILVTGINYCHGRVPIKMFTLWVVFQ